MWQADFWKPYVSAIFNIIVNIVLVHIIGINGVFISTIGAFSSGGPVIPFSYSRKFEGLFGNLNYNYVVNGRVENTESAVRKTLQYVLDYEKLKTAELKSMVKVYTLLDEFCSKLRILIEK